MEIEGTVDIEQKPESLVCENYGRKERDHLPLAQLATRENGFDTHTADCCNHV